VSVLGIKIWRDLWKNPSRTFLVVLSTAVGVFALGLVFGLFDEMRSRIAENHRATLPAYIHFHTAPFDQDAVAETLREPGVTDAEGLVHVSFRWKLEGEADWQKGTLIARADYHTQHLDRIDLVDGQWPSLRALAIERLSLKHHGLSPGTTILVDAIATAPGQRTQELPVAGTIRDPKALPPQLGFGGATFFATPETIVWLTGQEPGFNQLGIRLESFSQEGVKEAAERIARRLERMDLAVYGYVVQDPQVHWAQERLDTAFLISMVLGTFSLGLSIFLIINTMNAIIAQQVWQIGVIKVVGATSSLVVSIYLITALAYGLLSLLLAVPLGAVAAHLTARWLLDMVNVIVDDFQVMPAAVGIQVAVGLIAPTLAALVPVMGGARITPHQAITTYGLGAGFGQSWLDRLTGQIRRLPCLLSLGLRNIFRRKTRVALTLLALILSGVMFIMVMSVDSSLKETIEMILQEMDRDIQVSFEYLYPTQPLVQVTESVSGVARVEIWNHWGTQLVSPSGEKHLIGIWGVPSDTQMFHPRIASGRALLPDDDHAILLNSNTAADEGLQVGDEITLLIGVRESAWTIAGLIVSPTNSNYVPFDTLAQETGAVNRGGVAMVRTEQDEAADQERLVRDLRDAYEASKVQVSRFHSANEIRQVNRSLFSIITNLMLIMVALAAVVGSIGLMSTMSINVVERAREIGVMRAIGATSSAVAGIFVIEGVLVGLASWLIAVPLSYPSARIFGNAVGYTLMQATLNFYYSGSGVLLWLIIVIVLSALASLWPALRATKVSVRDALEYE
jgi:putative ABC transport system permease protein